MQHCRACKKQTKKQLPSQNELLLTLKRRLLLSGTTSQNVQLTEVKSSNVTP